MRSWLQLSALARSPLSALARSQLTSSVRLRASNSAFPRPLQCALARFPFASDLLDMSAQSMLNHWETLAHGHAPKINEIIKSLESGDRGSQIQSVGAELLDLLPMCSAWGSIISTLLWISSNSNAFPMNPQWFPCILHESLVIPMHFPRIASECHAFPMNS